MEMYPVSLVNSPPEVITNFTLDYPVIGFEIEFNPQE